MDRAASPHEPRSQAQPPPQAAPPKRAASPKDSPAQTLRKRPSRKSSRPTPAVERSLASDAPRAHANGAAPRANGANGAALRASGGAPRASDGLQTSGPQSIASTAVEPPGPTPMAMLDAALERGADPATLDKLLDLHERLEHSRARRAFEVSMAAARAEIPPIKRNRRAAAVGGTRRGYRHEDLGEIARTINPILARQGLSYRFRTSSVPNEPVSVTCIVSHHMGHYEENSLQGPRDDSGDKNGIQAIGSTITYLQRYTLKAALGLAAAHDDDGASSGIGSALAEGADDPLTDEQLEQLTSLLDEAGADSRKFCVYLGIDSLGALRQSRLKDAVAALKAKRKKKAGQAL